MLLFLHATAQAHPMIALSTSVLEITAVPNLASTQTHTVQAPPENRLNPMVRICDNDEPYPPFRWQTVDKDGVKRSHGFGLYLVSDILYRNNWRFSIDYMPIKRCLREVQTGEQYQLILNSSASAERRANYLITAPYYHVRFHAFYRAQDFPDGLTINNAEELKQYRLCGVSGHNFSMFNVPEASFDMGAPNIPAAVEKLKKGRCQIFPYNIEVIKHHKLIGWDFTQESELRNTPLNYVEKWPLRMLISMNAPFGIELQQLIDKELNAMAESGELERRMEKFLNNHL